MKRTIPISNCLQYAGTKPVSVVICLAGIGEISNDVTIIERNIKLFANLASGLLVLDNRIILGANLRAGQDGYYANTIGPLLKYAQTFNLPIDFSGLSLGGMGIGLNLPTYPGAFRSAMTCPGKVEANVGAGPIQPNGQPQWPAIDYVAAYRVIPSIHYYDPADKTIGNGAGYTSTRDLVAKLQAEGKKDITLITLPGKGHDVWDYAYSAENYWNWLTLLDNGAVPVPVPPTPVPVTESHLFVNGIDCGKASGTITYEIKDVIIN